MVAVHDDGEVTSATLPVDLERPLAGPIPAGDLRLEHGVDLAQPTEAVDLRRAAGREPSPSPLDPPAWPPQMAGARPARWHTSASWPPLPPRRWPGCSSFNLASHPDLKLARRIGTSHRYNGGN